MWNGYMTRNFQNNKTKIMNRDMSAQEIIEFLENGAVYRSFRDILEEVYEGDDLKTTLTDRLTEITGGKRNSVSRNVRNWLGDSPVLPQRQQLFQICFALELNEWQASQVLASASETGIHYRNPRELVYAYCLRTGQTWQKAQELVRNLEPVWKSSHSCGKKNGQAQKLYTWQIRQDFGRKVNSEAELKTFFWEYGGLLGELHETAYGEFIRMLDLLQDPDREICREIKGYIKKYRDDFSDDEIKKFEEYWNEADLIPVGEVLKRYFQMNVPVNTTRKKGQKIAKKDKEKKGEETEKPKRDYTYLQNVIRRNWPSENILAKMRSRETDVTRKVLLLLFLVTEEFEVRSLMGTDGEEIAEDNYLDELEEAENAAERMEIRLMRMNLFLEQFGMNRLDPGNAFDCLVLYALRASLDDGEGMSDRFQRAIEKLFSDPVPHTEKI